MELSVIASAVRRYFWVPIVLALLGAVPGVLQWRSSTIDYESRAVMLLSPSDHVGDAAGDADRYISGQLSVLGSDVIASRAVELLDTPMSPAQALGSTTFRHTTGTDVVVVVARTDSPASAPQLANAFVDAYLKYLQERLDEATQPERQRLQEHVTTLQGQLDQIDTELQAVIEPYLNAEPDPGTNGYPPIPTLEQLAPSLVSQRAVLLNELTQARADQASFAATARTAIVSTAVQRAEPGPVPIESASKRLIALGLVAGGFLGLLAAVLLARVSPRVVDSTELEDVLGHPLVGEMPPVSELRRGLTTDVPDDLVPFITELCVRIEANERSEGPIAVVVTGTQRESGASTLAVAIATWFATGGLQVCLVDADRRHPDIGTTFGALPGAEEEPEPPRPNGRRPNRPPRARWLTPPVATSVPHLVVSSLADPLAVRRANATDLFTGAGAGADVVVVDAGPILATATAVHLTRAADTVVLTVPRRQSARSLAEIAREFRDRPVLVVWTPTRSRLLGFVSSRSLADRQHVQREPDADATSVGAG